MDNGGATQQHIQPDAPKSVLFTQQEARAPVIVGVWPQEVTIR
jgi:hypothetical protein